MKSKVEYRTVHIGWRRNGRLETEPAERGEYDGEPQVDVFRVEAGKPDDKIASNISAFHATTLIESWKREDELKAKPAKKISADGGAAIVKGNVELWVGVVPEIFGYGMTVMATSKEHAMTALKAEYRRWKKMQGEHADPTTTFAGSFENFGGHVKRIEVGKVYYDNFRE